MKKVSKTTKKPYRYVVTLTVLDGDTVWQTLTINQEQLDYDHLIKVQRAVVEGIAKSLFTLGEESAAKKRRK